MTILPWLLVLALPLLSTPAECSRILFVLPFPGKSHHSFATAVMKALSEHGHHTVEYSPFPPKHPLPNHTHVELHTSFEKALDKWNLQDLIEHDQASSHYDWLGFRFKRILDMNYGVCEETFQNANIRKLLNSNEKFDLVITEATFGEESLLVFGHRFSAPTVNLEPFFLHSVLNRYAGNDLSISYISDLFTGVPKYKHLSFIERIKNFFSISATLFYHHFVHIPRQEEILRRFYKHSEHPPLNDIVTNISLYLTNSHPTIVNYVRPITPNIVPLGGLNIFPDRNPVTPELAEFLDSAKDGFIYFSLGTVVPAHHFPKEMLQIYVNVFNKLPQKVLWKIQLENIPGLSKNVKLVKFAPQLTVLGHRHCRLFMTHGGLFSHHEALHAGIPTLNLPFFADQPYNARYTEILGTGMTLDVHNLSEQSLHATITAIVSDNKFRENAARVSRIYRDRPLTPKQTAVFWLEYVMKYKGAAHLRPVSASMPWYQLVLLDVIAVLVAVVVVTALVFLLVIRRLCCSGRKQQKVSNSKKKR